ncbi:hypothetical protein [Candidatus Leptofilum sp.]|uniref:hypothetical protein n=1 Tax=Candidatus Leptofilum sp. TaxID=3241576 RepID=UPI003B5C808B
MFPSVKLLTLSNRIYCLLLYLYPASFRREYGTHMAQLFRDDVRGTLQESGGLAVMDLWLVAFFDLLKTAVAEHFLELFHMPIDKLTRWSGPVGAVGGLLYAVGVASIIYGAAPFTISLLATVPLLALRLFGLYKCLPATESRLNTVAFAASVSGLLLSNIGSVILVWSSNPRSNWDNMIFIGLGLWIMGFAGMGAIALVNRTLGRLSFTPLLAVVALTGMGSLYGTDPTSPIGITLLTTYAASWILLGVALWQANREPLEPGTFA